MKFRLVTQTHLDWTCLVPWCSLVKRMNRSAGAVFLVVFCAGVATARAQVAPSAYRSQFTLTAGGLGSVFQPDYAGNAIAQTSPNRLYGIGAFVDVKFTRWAQLEAEGRWQRFNQFENIYEDNYLIGPILPIHHFQFMHATPYAKVLAGVGKINFEFSDAYGHFTALAYGGGVDFKLTDRISARGDFEYQQWPGSSTFLNHTTLYPYGASAGVSYRILGGRGSLRRLTKKEKQAGRGQ